MYNMMVNSAVSQCGADKSKKHNIEEVKELINKSIEQVPTYVDSVYDTNGKHILNGIHQITADDLLKQYVKYNRERSIEDSIDLKQFNSFLDNLDNMKYIQRWSEGLLNQTKLEQKEGSDELPVDVKGFDSAIDKAQEKSGNISKADKKDKAELETMKKKFTTMLKSVLYSCICMNNIPEDIMNYIELVCSDSECEQIAKDFKIDVDELSDIISRMNDAEIMQINMLIYQLKCLLDDKKLKPIQRVSNAISKLGQLDKNEVVTGSDLVNKMLDKLGDRDMSGKSILEVNSKYGEFLIQIYERYGKEVANNVKVVASSDMTKNFIRKVLNILELDEQNLIELEDYNGNGMYDIKDFVEAPNEKILKYNNMKKWDVILANPPFNLGEKMLTKWFDLADTICTVQPSTWLLGKKKTKSICSHLDSGEFNADIESINGNEFFDTGGIGGVMAIQYFYKNPTKHNDCLITFDNKQYTKTDDISLTSNDELLNEFKSIVEPLYINDNFDLHLKLTNKILPNDGTNKYLEKRPNKNWNVIQIPRIRGSKDKQNPAQYTFFTKEMGYKIQKYTEFDDGTPKLYIVVNNINITNYCFSYFARTCLMFLKTSITLGKGELKYVPWFDFSEPIFSKSPSEIDDYLFAKYNISDEIRKHIENILPSYKTLGL